MISGKNKFYITTAIPYVNARPHLGHALEFVQADVIARYHRAKGEDTTLLSGGDENALKNVHAAEEAGVPLRRFIDTNTALFADLAKRLNVQFNVFQRGSDEKHHYPSSQELWRRCDKAGDIYKKLYQGLYCVGCETFYAPDELTESGECPEHPGRKLDTVSEENYFFQLSKYRERLREIITADALRIVPAHRKNEVLAFLESPLEDISISRSNERAKNWGVPVPGDDTQRIYVWFDALNIYQSGVGFGWDERQYKKWWPADVHLIGKGIIRFHAVYWPAFLLSAGLSLPKSLYVHGYLTVDGKKMSKTVGNVVDPFELVQKYGVDPVRYYLLREIPSGEDGDFSIAKFEARYNGELANGLGNLVARVVALAAKLKTKNEKGNSTVQSEKLRNELDSTQQQYANSIAEFRLNEALEHIWRLVRVSDQYINDERPWEEEKPAVIHDLLFVILRIAELLKPFLPETAEKIQGQIAYGDGIFEIKKSGNLFPRLE